VTLPRVTAILADVGLGPDLSGIPEAVLEYARERGSAVHAAIEADFYGYLDEEALAIEVVERLDAYRRFVKESQFQPEIVEFRVVHEAWRYQGHPDMLGWLMGRRTIVDWKATDVVHLKPASLQLAAYRAAWNAMHPDQPVEQLAVVQLKGDGSYRFHEVAAAEAEPLWFAAVMVFHARHERLVAA
jgi:hypothetical protein